MNTITAHESKNLAKPNNIDFYEYYEPKEQL